MKTGEIRGFSKNVDFYQSEAYYGGFL